MTADMHKKYPGVASIFCFDFEVYVDTAQNYELISIVEGDFLIRVYPLFRSGDANQDPLPPLRLDAIPFLREARPNKSNIELPKLSAYLLPPVKGGGGFETVLCAGAAFDRDLQPFPMDSLRIDVVTSSGIADEAHVSNVALQISRDVLRFLRVVTKQWWIGHSSVWKTDYQRAIFPILENGRPLNTPWSTSKFFAPSGFERAVSEGDWCRLSDNLSGGVGVARDAEMFLDAIYEFASGRLEVAVLNAAMACELARNRCFSQVHNCRNPGKSFRRGRELKGDNLPEHLKRDAKKFIGSSFCEVNSEAYSLICDLWLTRNHVAHGFSLSETAVPRVGKVDASQLKAMLGAVEQCLRWLQDSTAAYSAA